MPTPSSNSVVVICGVMACIHAELDLTAAEKNVILVDSACAIGGPMTQFDQTFPTNNCDTSATCRRTSRRAAARSPSSC